MYPLKETFADEDGLFTQFRKEAEEKEVKVLHSQAALSKNHSREFGAEIDHRLPYKRDVDRIVHSKAYTRYIDKTQVVYLVPNDHVTHRGLHVQLVSNFARGIAEILRLNTDLVEAVALGHDVGHSPFGHEGEVYLSELSMEHGNGPFAHPYQSCRLLSKIEPLNLGLAVYDGFLCHDGGMKTTVLEPRFGKTWSDHRKDLEQKLEDPEGNILPGTMEGCLVKICDTMSYVGRDIEDAIQLGIITRDQVPETILGTTNRGILSQLARDVIRCSYGKNFIAMSDEAFDALQRLRTFNFRHIYVHPVLKKESEKVKRSYRILFDTLLDDMERQPSDGLFWKDFLLNKPSRYRKETSPVQCVVDYISGMTDNHFVRTLERLVLPQTIQFS